MILFFNLDICQQLAQLGFRKFENIGIVFGRNHFFCTNAVGCQEAVVFLVFVLCQGAVGCLWIIIPAAAVIAVAGWHAAGKHFAE